MNTNNQENENSSKETFKILSLDGGGYKGLCTIACLAELEDKFNVKCADVFDMFAGTSTGSIIALALAKGESAQTILEIYEKLGDKVFPNKYIGIRFIRQFFIPKYRNKSLKAELYQFFGDLKLKDIHEREKYIIVPALNLSNGHPRIFKTDYNTNFNQHNQYKLADIALASSAAPTFFPVAKIDVPNLNTYELFVDGGMFANNPAVCALVDAQRHIGINIEDIRMLSIATPTFNLDIKESKFLPFLPLNKGILSWGEKLVSMALQGTALRDAFIAKFMLKDKNYLRLDPKCYCNLPKAMDSTDQLSKSQLIRSGKELAVNNFNNNLIKELFKNKENVKNG